MPLLGALLTSLFVGLAEFFAKWVTRKVAAAAAGIAVFAALSTAVYLLLAGLVATIVVSLPGSAAIATGIWIALPDNAGACVSAALTADAAIAVYRMNVTNVMFAVYAP